jgi:hypothetical protein
MVREIARAGIEFSVSQPRTREIISIVTRSVPARQAQQSGLVEVHRRLSEAFAAKVGSASRNSLKPRMLTRLTLMAVDLTLGSWYEGEFKEWQAALKQVFSQLNRVFCDSDQTPISKAAHGNGRKR